MGNELALQESQQLEVQVKIANQFPRKLDTFVDDVFAVVKRDQDFAMSCVYCVPVGKQDDGSQKFAMGPGVRLSEEMQKYWKHLRVAVTCDITVDKIIVNGMVVDCQANNAETLVDQVTITGWKDRRVSLKAKAMQSIMKRDLRMSIIGKSYADELLRKIIDELLSDRTAAWGYCKEKYAELGVDEKDILRYFKVGKAEELTNKHIYQAIGMYNYLVENAEAPEYVFGGAHASTKPAVTPDMVKEKKPQPQAKGKTKQAAAPVPEVSDSEEFERTVFMLLMGTGLTEKEFTAILDAEFSIVGGVKAVPADKQQEILDYLETRQEGTGA